MTNAHVSKLFLGKRSIQVARHTNVSGYGMVTNMVLEFYISRDL